MQNSTCQYATRGVPNNVGSAGGYRQPSYDPPRAIR